MAGVVPRSDARPHPAGGHLDRKVFIRVATAIVIDAITGGIAGRRSPWNTGVTNDPAGALLLTLTDVDVWRGAGFSADSAW